MRQLGKGLFRGKKRRIVIDLFLLGIAERVVGFAGCGDVVAAVGRYRANGVDKLDDTLRLGDLPELAVTAEVKLGECLFQRIAGGCEAHASVGHVLFQRVVAAIILVMEA